MSAAGDLVARWVRPEILELSAYHVQDADGLVKLDAMENPYPLPAGVRSALAAALAEAELNRYPDGAARRVKATLARRFSVPDGVELILGNGSDELLELAMIVAGGPGRTVLAPAPTFSMYALMAKMTGTRFVSVPLERDTLALDLPALIDAIEREAPALVILARPNNPTGLSCPRAELDAVIHAAPGFVVVDEAYAPFASDAVLADVASMPGVICLRTLSKMGLAGIRLGFAIAAPAVVDALERARLPYNVNVLTQIAAETVLAYPEVLEAQVADIVASRARLAAALEALPGLRVFRSETNFLLVDTPFAAGKVFDEVRARGVLVKSMAGAHPFLEHAIRVTVGTDDENARFVAALEGALAALTGR